MFTIFILTSVTYAIKGQTVLKNTGIRSSLTKQAELKPTRNCGYGLKVHSEDALRARELLDGAGIRVLGSTEVKA